MSTTTDDLYPEIRHEATICSACPYSEGPDASRILCSLWNGVLYSLISPVECAVINEDPHHPCDFTDQEFLAKMEREHGQESARRFTIKRESIRECVRMIEGL